MIIPQNPETGEMQDKPRGPDALRRAADMAEASACGDRVDAGLVLLGRMAERLVMGTLSEDEAGALVAVLTTPACRSC